MRKATPALAVLATLILAFIATPAAVAQKGSFELALGGGLTTLDNKNCRIWQSGNAPDALNL